MNKEYFDQYELGARKKIREWNEKSHVFDTITDYPRNHYVDFSGTCRGHNVNIEVKDRNLNLMEDGTLSGGTKYGKTYKVDTLYIESHKVGSLLLDYHYYGLEPLYFNFLNDGYVVLYNLRKFKQVPPHKRVKISSGGYEREEYEYRFELSLKDAAIYKNGVLIKKQGADWTNEPEPFC